MSAAVYPATQARRTPPGSLTSRRKSPIVKNEERTPLVRSVDDESRRRVLIGRAQRGDKSARDRLVEENLGLPIHFARWYADHCQLRILDTDDLTQEGSIGLLRAIEKFDLARQDRFSTYASWWIRANIRRAIKKQEPSVSLPMEVDIPDWIVDVRSERQLERVEEADNDRMIAAVLLNMLKAKRITAREVCILSRRFALNQTLQEIGAYLGINRERVRQLETTAKAKLAAEMVHLGMAGE